MPREVGGGSITDLINTVTKTVKISLVDRAFHVRIGDVELGLRRFADPDLSQPNPNEIRWTQENEIVIHKTPGQTPLTQCTIPRGLWEADLKVNTLKGMDGDINETLVDIRDMDAGPRRVKDALFKDGICMYLQRKEITQPAATDDYYHNLQLHFIQANDS